MLLTGVHPSSSSLKSLRRSCRCQSVVFCFNSLSCLVVLYRVPVWMGRDQGKEKANVEGSFGRTPKISKVSCHAPELKKKFQVVVFILWRNLEKPLFSIHDLDPSSRFLSFTILYLCLHQSREIQQYCNVYVIAVKYQIFSQKKNLKRCEFVCWNMVCLPVKHATR